MIRELQYFETRHCFYQNELDLTTLVSTLSLFMRFNLAGSVWSVSCSRLELNTYTCNADKQRVLFHFFRGGEGECRRSEHTYASYHRLSSPAWVQPLYRARKREYRDWTTKRMELYRPLYSHGSPSKLS